MAASFVENYNGYNRLYPLAVMYPIIIGAGSAYSFVTWATGRAWAVASYAFTTVCG